jgi:hypothetical protein
MKKIALFAATMMLCAGIAMAQEPVKKENKANTKANTEAQAVNSKDQAANNGKTTTQAAPAQKSCGNCPHHAQCQGKSAQKPAKPAPRTSEAKPKTVETPKK